MPEFMPVQISLPAILAVIVILLAIGLLVRKKPEEPEEPDYVQGPRKPIPPIEKPAQTNPATSQKSTPVRRSGTEFEEATFVSQEDTSVGSDFFSDVAFLLRDALTADPGRQDLRFKLLEVYCDAGDQQHFMEEMEEYRDRMGRNADANWPKIQEMQSSLSVKELEEETEIESDGESDGKEQKFKRFGDIPRAKAPLETLAKEYAELRKDRHFYTKLDLELTRTADRPRRLHYAETLSTKIGGAKIYIKREDTSTRLPRLRVHMMGQAWLANLLGREKLYYSTISGEEAIIAALAAARAKLKCEIFIPDRDSRLTPNHKYQIEFLGAQIRPVPGAMDYTDLREHLLDVWLDDHENSFMMLSLAAGPHPYPSISADLQGVIGRETLRQLKGQTGKIPKAVFSRGSTHNADPIGFVEPFLPHTETEIFLINPAEEDHKQAFEGKSPENSLYTQFISDRQRESANYILNELEFPSVKRELETLKLTERITFKETSILDAKYWGRMIGKCEGLILPLETAHVLAEVCSYARQVDKDQCIVMMLAEHLEKDLVSKSAADL